LGANIALIHVESSPCNSHNILRIAIALDEFLEIIGEILRNSEIFNKAKVILCNFDSSIIIIVTDQ